MATIVQQAKSKTNRVNAILTGLVAAAVPIAESYGVKIPPEAVAGFFALANWILRFFTKEPLEAK